jgi:hypothetical protein
VVTPLPIDIAASKLLRKHIHAIPKKCFSNSIRALISIHANDMEIGNHVFESPVYVEGWAVDQIGLVLEHGWIEDRGQMIEVTLEMPFLAYFPGVRYSMEELGQIMKYIPSPKLPLVGYGPHRSGSWGGGHGWTIPSFKQSYADAIDWRNTSE